MAFTAKDVAALREKTGCGMMDCKKALTETDGDMEKAVDFLREKGLAAAQKKASRIAAEGVVVTKSNGSSVVVLEVNAETDFVAKNKDFGAFVDVVADTILAESPADVDALAQCKAVGTDLTVAELLQEKILVIGENMKIRRFVKYDGAVCGYTHAGNRIAVIAKFATEATSEEIAAAAKTLCMHITMYKPEYLNKEAVPAEIVEHEREVLKAQAMAEGKPEAIAEKMVMGRINKFFKESCFYEQGYIMDEDITVGKYLENLSKELGKTVAVEAYTRFEVGEGLEKREDNFAEEVAKMVQ